MPIKKWILGSLVVSALGSLALPAAARTNVDVVVNFGAPPAPVYEYAAAPRIGFVWAPGYWDWRGARCHWVTGHYVRNRPGYVYRQTHWYAHDGRWHLARGGWDRDGDGVPNYADRFPGNPYRN